MRFHKSWLMGAMALAALSGAVGTAQAQERTPKPDSTTVLEKVQIESVVAGDADALMAVGGPNTFLFLSADASFERKTVKGVPYSAEATTETIQTLGDGNRIIRKNSTSIYRDSEGRTRREQTLGAIGQWTVAGEPPRSVFINDPVSRVNYVLDPKTQTARKMIIPQLLSSGNFTKVVTPPANNVNGTAAVRVLENTVSTAPMRERNNGLQPKTESLGKQMIEGVEAEGTRTTITIPAGHIGNERPIDIVTERWYSPELQVVVYSKKTDPMAGETTYRLTNINRDEPARSLFEVPAGYKIKEGPEINLFNRERKIFEERKAQQ